MQYKQLLKSGLKKPTKIQVSFRNGHAYIFRYIHMYILCSMYQYTAYSGNLIESEYEHIHRSLFSCTSLAQILRMGWVYTLERIEMGPLVLFPWPRLTNPCFNHHRPWIQKFDNNCNGKKTHLFPPPAGITNLWIRMKLTWVSCPLNTRWSRTSVMCVPRTLICMLTYLWGAKAGCHSVAFVHLPHSQPPLSKLGETKQTLSS